MTRFFKQIFPAAVAISAASTGIAAGAYGARRIGDPFDHPGRETERTQEAHMGATGNLVSTNTALMSLACYAIANRRKLTCRQSACLIAAAALCIGANVYSGIEFSSSKQIGTAALVAGGASLFAYSTMAKIESQHQNADETTQPLVATP